MRVIFPISLTFTRFVVQKIDSYISGRMSSVGSRLDELISRFNEVERLSKLLESEIKSIRKGILLIRQDVTDETSCEKNDNSSKKQTLKRPRSALLINALPFGESSQLKKFKDETDSKGNNFVMEGGYVVVYTDGACENNGKPNAKAGIGVWFGDHSPLNISKPVVGKATNNTAEIQACTEALKIVQNTGESKVKIITDSKFTISCITQWIHNWKKNDWKLASGGPVKNKTELQKLDSLVKSFQDVKFEYVAGHKGNKGNEEADKLARKGAALYVKI